MYFVLCFKNSGQKKKWKKEKICRQTLEDNNQLENSIVTEMYLEPNCTYHFSTNASFGDGLCCYEGNGAYELNVNGTTMRKGENLVYLKNLIFKH